MSEAQSVIEIIAVSGLVKISSINNIQIKNNKRLNK